MANSIEKQIQLSELERKADILRMEIYETDRLVELANRERIEKKSKVEVYASSDYAGMVCEDFEFYYGYEATWCAKCGVDIGCEHDDVEWCFIAYENKAEVFRLRASQLPVDGDSMLFVLVHGIGQFINIRGIKCLTK